MGKCGCGPTLEDIQWYIEDKLNALGVEGTPVDKAALVAQIVADPACVAALQAVINTDTDTNTTSVSLVWNDATDTFSLTDSDGNTLSDAITGFLAGLTIEGAGDITVTGSDTTGYVVSYTDADYTYALAPNAEGTGFVFTTFLDGVVDSVTNVPFPAGGDVDTDTTYVPSTAVNPNGGIDLSWQLTDVATGNPIGAPIQVLCLQQRLLDCDGVALAKDTQVVTKDRLLDRVEVNEKSEIINGIAQTEATFFDANDNEVASASFGQSGSQRKYGAGSFIPEYNGVITVMVQADLADPSTYRPIRFNPAEGRVVPENYKGFVYFDTCTKEACPVDAPRRGCLDLTRPVGGGNTLADLILIDPDIADQEGVIVLNGVILPRADCWEEYIDTDANGNERRWKALENQGWVSQSPDAAGSVSTITPEFDGTGADEVLLLTHDAGDGSDPVEVYGPAPSNGATVDKADLVGLALPPMKSECFSSAGPDGQFDSYRFDFALNTGQTIELMEYQYLDDPGGPWIPLAAAEILAANDPNAATEGVLVRYTYACDGVTVGTWCQRVEPCCPKLPERGDQTVAGNTSLCILFRAGSNSIVSFSPNDFIEGRYFQFEGAVNNDGNATIGQDELTITNTSNCVKRIKIYSHAAIHAQSIYNLFRFDAFLARASDIDAIANQNPATNWPAQVFTDFGDLLPNGDHAQSILGFGSEGAQNGDGTDDANDDGAGTETCLVVDLEPGQTETFLNRHFASRMNDGDLNVAMRFHIMTNMRYEVIA